MGGLCLDAQIDHGDPRHNESLSGLVFVWDFKQNAQAQGAKIPYHFNSHNPL